MPQALEDRVGYKFRDPSLLKAALTHKSYASESRIAHYNERLEFLGDSILSAVVAHRLYERYPHEDEGSLSKRKALLVSRATLSRWAGELGLGDFLYLGTGERTSGGKNRPSILSNALEALIGAIYLDGSYDAARRFILGWLDDEDPVFTETDYKSRLQEILQKRYKVTPHYNVIQTAGPDHDKTFSVQVQLSKQVLGEGAGKSKKEAEQAAAKDALEHLKKSN